MSQKNIALIICILIGLLFGSAIVLLDPDPEDVVVESGLTGDVVQWFAANDIPIKYEAISVSCHALIIDSVLEVVDIEGAPVSQQCKEVIHRRLGLGYRLVRTLVDDVQSVGASHINFILVRDL